MVEILKYNDFICNWNCFDSKSYSDLLDFFKLKKTAYDGIYSPMNPYDVNIASWIYNAENRDLTIICKYNNFQNHAYVLYICSADNKYLTTFLKSLNKSHGVYVKYDCVV